MDDEPNEALAKSLEDTGQAVRTAAYGDPTGHATLLAVGIGIVVAGAQLVVHLLAAMIRPIHALVSRARALVGGRRGRTD